jgi:multidrug efflux pump subunit AcrB
VREAFEGRTVRTIAAQDEEITIRLERLSSAQGSAALLNLWVRSPAGAFVPLSSVVDFSERQGFDQINREDGRSVVSVRADTEDGVDSSEILNRLESDYLPAIAGRYGLDYKLGGRRAEQNAAFADLGIGALFALGIMYIIIAWIFQSYFAPLAVMLIIPFGSIGAIWGHYLLGYDLTIISVMGLLGLAGILVNDSIVLISRMQERLSEGEGLRSAATGAARDRLRAVLLTSLTTIGGLAPLLFEKSLQAQFLIPMAVTIVFGLGLSTLLVLFLVPSFVGIGSDIGAIMRWLFLAPNAPTFRELMAGRHHEAPPTALAE